MGRPMDFTNVLTWGLGGGAIVWYYICIIYLGFLHPQPDPSIDEAFRHYLSSSISTLSTTLATYVGLIIGVQTASRAPGASKVAAVFSSKVTPVTNVQGWAAISYLVSVFLAVGAWWYHPEADPSIKALGSSFLGLAGGALAVIRNVNVKNEQ
jgi:hypothetical protein